jgi:hypothetical protein
MAGSATSSHDTKNEADVMVKKACIEPLEAVTGKEVANVIVSSELQMNQSSNLPIHTFIIAKNGYEYTLANLIQLTFDLVKDQVAVEASVVTAIAQRVNPRVNIEGCIA